MTTSLLRVKCTCGAQHQAKPEFAGRRGKCPKCGGVLEIPSVPSPQSIVINSTAIPRRAVGTWIPDRELRSQLVVFAIVLAILAIFGRDWFNPVKHVTSSTVVTRSAPPSGEVAPLEMKSGSSKVVKVPGDKLPLADPAAEGGDEVELKLGDLLPPIQQKLSRRELPFDCPSANGVRSVAFVPDGSRAMTVHQTDRGAFLRQWDIVSGAPIGQPVPLPASNDYQLTFSPDGGRLAMILSPAERGLLLFNAKTGVCLRTRITNQLTPLSAPAWCGDGSLIYGTPVGTVEQWHIVPDVSGFSLSQGQPVTRVSATDAGYVLSGDAAGEVRLWLAGNGRYAASYRALKAPIRVLETRRTKNGVLVLTAGGEPGESWHVHLFDLQTQKTLHSLMLSGPVVSLAVASDWRRIVTGRRDGMVTVWDMISGDELETVSAHNGEVTALCVSPDNSCLMSGCYRSQNNRDVTVRLRPMPAVFVPQETKEETEE